MQVSHRQNSPLHLRDSEELEEDLMDFAAITPAHAAVVITLKVLELVEYGCTRINDEMIQRVKNCGGDCEDDILPSRINQYVRSFF